MKKQKRTFPIKLLIAVSICISIFISAFVFLTMAYNGMAGNILSATQVAAKYIADTVNQSVKLTLSPCDVTIKMLHLSDIGQAKTLKERLKYVPLFAEALRANPIGDAVYIGYETGEFYLLRRYQENMGNLKITAPPKSNFLLQTRTLLDDGSFGWELWFYDDSLNLLSRQSTSQLSLDPRERVWYKLAQQHTGLITTRPYVYFDTKQTGVSLAQRTANGKAVVAIDATTQDLSRLLATLLITDGTQLVLIDETGEIVAYPDMSRLANKKVGPDGAYELAALELPILNQILKNGRKDGSLTEFKEGRDKWYGLMVTLDSFYGNGLQMISAIPGDELLKDLWTSVFHQGLTALAVLLLILPCGWRFGKWLAHPLHSLTKQVVALSEFDFDAPIGVPTRTKEVQELGNVLREMAQAINGFRSMSRTLNRERDLEKMIVSVLQELLHILRIKAGAVYLHNEKSNTLYLTAEEGNKYNAELALSSAHNTDEQLIQYCAERLGQENIYAPLRNRENDLIGILCLTYPEGQATDAHTRQSSLIRYIDNVAGSVAVAIETRQLIHAQKALLESLIKLIADAIDTKSLYTGGHCRRVPELSLMLLEEIIQADTPPFDNFSFSKNQSEEFRIAAWLHDCGKITTPEYVVDKATKLETIYNRLHEVRTRFEVLHRDALIRCQQAIIDGADPLEAKEICRNEQDILQEEFAFVAKCNIGGEAMQAEDLQRLQTIGQRVWWRYFDHRLGLSKDELIRLMDSEEPNELPAQEFLLADKKSLIVPWRKNIPPVQADDAHNVWGFDMKLPQAMYNYGEIYNLSIKRGTLTDEERFMINNHIVQTLCMLSSLPFPKILKGIPDIAANHHETLIGTGYPRKLKAENLAIPDRIIAVADVFEALTASDRPYKEGKTLRQALGILSRMVQNGHLDGDIFNILLSSGAYLRYAEKYLEADQIDVNDITEFLHVKSASDNFA